MKQGDFSSLAKDFVNRAGYSMTVLKILAAPTGAMQKTFTVADVGAGTGKLTENLLYCLNDARQQLKIDAS